MTEQEIKQKLQKMRLTNRYIKDLEMQLKCLPETQLNCNYESSGSARVTISDKTANTAIKYETLLEKIRNLKSEYRTLYNGIERLPVEFGYILHQRYIQGKTLRCIAVKSFCSHPTIIRQEQKAINQLYIILGGGL